jgi:beta-glucosidase
MKTAELQTLFKNLTVQDKIAQTIQLNGSVIIENDVMNTGPMEELGLPKDLNVYELGSIYNVNDPQKLKELQVKVLENSKHKIPMLFMSDVIYGFRTIFPMPLAQVGSYDFDLIKKAAELTAKESYLSGLHVLFSPMLDLSRDPRWGRVMESPGEDVYTAKEFAKNIVEGYQGESGTQVPKNHVAACLKHFAAYGAPEAGREYNTVDMSNQRLFNEYLQPYQAAIEANCELVMTAFNLLNGVPATGNEWLNRDILRGRFGFEGLLVSDYAAIKELIPHGYAKDEREAARKALLAGVDLDMMTSIYANHLSELVEDPHFMMLLDEAVWRILTLKNKLGLFEHPFRGLEEENTGEILTEQAKKTAIELVEKSCVLLKNDGTLPLKRDKKIAVIGPYGKSQLTLGFWASVSGKPQDTVTLEEGLSQHFESNQLAFAKGYNLFDSYEGFGPLKKGMEMLNGPIEEAEELIDEALAVAKDSDVILLTFGEQFIESGEGASKAHLRIPLKQQRLIKKLRELNKPIVGILYTGRPLVLTEVEQYFDSLLLTWFPGTMGGVGIANLLAGKTSPSGRLAMTFPRSEGQIPIYFAQYSTGRPLESGTHSERFISKYLDESNQPLFKFGTGKSYAEFESNLLASKKVDQQIELDYLVKNISSFAAETVAHIYLHQESSAIVRPNKRLVGSQRVYLNGQEEKQLKIKIPISDLTVIDNNGKEWLEKGTYHFYLDIAGVEKVSHLEL